MKDGKVDYKPVFGNNFRKILERLSRKDKSLVLKIEKQIIRVLKEPTLGKPLRNILRNQRRVHIDPFVLIYEIHDNEIWFLDFCHHDRIYKKH